LNCPIYLLRCYSIDKLVMMLVRAGMDVRFEVS
jgi:predicted XRE-type DNA-binding protein